MRATIVRSIVALFAALAAAACSASVEPDPDAPSVPLHRGEIQDTLIANTLYRKGGTWWRTWEYAGLHRADGTITGRAWWTGGEENAQGTWEVLENNLYCRTWSNHWADGEHGCFRVQRSGGTLIFDHITGSSGGSDRYIYLHKPGNPFGL